jgi:hypothetical protein
MMGPVEQISEDRRKEIFAAIVEAQDDNTDVIRCRQLIAFRFGLNDTQIEQIEQQGIEGGWPPL